MVGFRGCVVCLSDLGLGRGVGCVYGGRGTFSSQTKDSYAIALLMGRESRMGGNTMGLILDARRSTFFFFPSP